MDNTREFIIDEAFKLFLNRSYEAVSISDISKAIGFTKGALYHHFKNKEELFKSVVDRYLFIHEVVVDIDTISLVDYIDKSLAQSEKVMKTLFGFTQVFIPIDYISLFTDAYRHYPGYAELKHIFIDNEIKKTITVIENAIKSGEIRADVDPRLMATIFYSIHMGLAGNLLRSHSVDDAMSLVKNQTYEFYKLLKKL